MNKSKIEWCDMTWNPITGCLHGCEYCYAPQHRYLFLTKNPRRYKDIYPMVKGKGWWTGSTVTNDRDYAVYCTPHTQKTFVSVEPILDGWCDYPLIRNVDWVIVGAETGNRKGKVVPEREWIEDVATACRDAKTPIFMKNSLADIWGKPPIQEYPWEGAEG